VTLRVYNKEIVTVIGANGAGKTTLLRGISGLLEKRSGRILFEGKDVTRLSPQALTALGIAQVPEGRHIFPTLSTLDNLTMGAYWRLRQRRKTGKKDLSEDVALVNYIFRLL
jgi:branched-chain amino acid transport system ATP-binding protein